jgi:4-oxalocrotonate tautomerase
VGAAASARLADNPVLFHVQEDPMPTIRVELFEGRTPEQKKAFVKALTQACVDTLGSKPEGVDVLLYDIKPSDWATGGELWSEKKKG